MLFNEFYECETGNEAFEYWYNLLLSQKDSDASRDGQIVGEIINSITVINDPTRCFVTSKIRNLSARYIIGELLWYLSGNNSLKEIQKFTSGWNRMSDDGETVNSNYGYCIQHKFGFNQWEFVKELLKKDPNSRQAVIHIKTADNRESKDVNCTVCLQFFIRSNKLYMTAYMRSNDIWLGFPIDVFQFTAMQILMSMQLGVELGSYTHHVGSLHLYERNVKKVGEE